MWAYTIKGKAINLSRTRPLGEIQRYYMIESSASGYSPQVFSEGTKVLPFSHISDDVIIWQGFFPGQSLKVKVKGAVTMPKTVLEMALRHSRAVVSRLVPDSELAFSSAWDDKVSWLSSIQFKEGAGMDVKTVEVVVYDIEDLSRTTLEDIFKDSLAVISQEKGPEKIAAQTRKYWVRIKDPGATSFTKGAVISWEEFEREDKKVRERGEKPASVEIVKEPPPGKGNGNGQPENLPALRPFEPYHFAEYVLRYNRFNDDEVRLYSGLTGLNPLGVPDRIWREVVEGTEGEFVRQGDLNVFHVPDKEKPGYMRAQPKWRKLASTVEKKPFAEVGERVRYKDTSRGGKFRYGHWPKDVWLGDEVVEGAVKEFHQEQPAVDIGGEHFEKLDAWALVNWDNGADTAIMAEDEGRVWEKVTGGSPVCVLPGTREEDLTPMGWSDGRHPYKAPEGTKVSVIPVRASTGEGFALFDLHQGVWFGQRRSTYEDARKAADKENIRLASYSKFVPSPRDESEFIADSPELIPFTIDDIGYRDKLDKAFELAIARVKKS